ncbi:MAG TPA: hypothetical protein PKE40_14845 [Arachnia sp.]|nr:hypothetical protein [Arachnia sp.]HMT87621.1 hypothetical protein [Arachnia sp.]
MTEETIPAAEGALQPSRRAVVRAAAWAAPVVTGAMATPYASASGPVDRIVQFLDVDGTPTESYERTTCDPFDVTVEVLDDGVAAPAGTEVTVTLPVGITWNDGTTGATTVAVDGQGRATITGLLLKDAAFSLALGATAAPAESGQPAPSTASVVTSGGDAVRPTLRGRANGIESFLPASVTSVRDAAIAWTRSGISPTSRTYTSYVVDQDGGVWTRTDFSGVQSEDPLVTWDDFHGTGWTSVPGRSGVTLVATDDSSVGGSASSALFTSDGSVVHDFTGAALPVLPGGRSIVDLAAGFISLPPEWRVVVVADDGTGWYLSGPSAGDGSSVSWLPGWTQYTAISGASAVAMDTTAGPISQVNFATPTAILYSGGGVAVNAPSGVQIQGISLAIVETRYHILGTDGVHRHYNWAAGVWTAEPGVPRTHVASTATPDWLAAFATIGISACPA